MVNNNQTKYVPRDDKGNSKGGGKAVDKTTLANNSLTPEELFNERLDIFTPPPTFDYALFHAIPETKQQAILDAAVKEFAVKGYRLASTNEIVRNAGVSKGILFRYFGSKESLYLYLLDYVSRLIIKDISMHTNFATCDIIGLLMNAAHVKLETAIKYPLEMKFYRDMLTADLPETIACFRNEMVPKSYGMMRDLLALMDDSMLKEEFEKEEVVSVVNWVLVGLAEGLINSSEIGNTKEEYETYMVQVDKYMDLMKKLFYKEEVEL